MSPSAKRLLDDALKLPIGERSALVAILIESLDAEQNEDVQATWDVEIARRVEELRCGEIQTIPWTEARRIILGVSNGPAAD